MNQSFQIVGSGSSPATATVNFNEKEINIVVKIYFSSKNKTIVLERTVPVLYREMQNIRF